MYREKTIFDNISVLVADNDPAFKTIIRAVLNALKITDIKFVESGKKAFEAANTSAFDVAIINRDLDDHSGVDVVSMLRVSPHSRETMLPVIMMAANWGMPQINAARDAGVNEYLVIPFSQAQLQKRLVAILKNPRPFIKDDDFFGPDRRRRENPALKPAERRIIDPEIIEQEIPRKARA